MGNLNLSCRPDDFSPLSLSNQPSESLTSLASFEEQIDSFYCTIPDTSKLSVMSSKIYYKNFSEIDFSNAFFEFSQDSRTLVIAHSNCVISFLYLDQDRKVFTQDPFQLSLDSEAKITAMSPSAEAHTIICLGTADGNVALLDVEYKKIIEKIKCKTSRAITSIAIAANRRFLVSVSSQGEFELFSLNSRQLVQEYSLPFKTPEKPCVSISADGKFVVVSSSKSHSAYVFNTETKALQVLCVSKEQNILAHYIKEGEPSKCTGVFITNSERVKVNFHDFKVSGSVKRKPITDGIGQWLISSETKKLAYLRGNHPDYEVHVEDHSIEFDRGPDWERIVLVSEPSRVAISPDASLFAIATQSNKDSKSTIHIYNKSLNRFYSFASKSILSGNLHYSYDGRYLIVESTMKFYAIINPRNYSYIQTIPKTELGVIFRAIPGEGEESMRFLSISNYKLSLTMFQGAQLPFQLNVRSEGSWVKLEKTPATNFMKGMIFTKSKDWGGNPYSSNLLLISKDDFRVCKILQNKIGEVWKILISANEKFVFFEFFANSKQYGAVLQSKRLKPLAIFPIKDSTFDYHAIADEKRIRIIATSRKKLIIFNERGSMIRSVELSENACTMIKCVLTQDQRYIVIALNVSEIQTSRVVVVECQDYGIIQEISFKRTILEAAVSPLGESISIIFSDKKLRIFNFQHSELQQSR